MKNEFLDAVRKIDAEDLALDMIEKGKRSFTVWNYTPYMTHFPALGNGNVNWGYKL